MRIFILALGFGVAALFAPDLALAEDHLAEAVSHTHLAAQDDQLLAQGRVFRIETPHWLERRRQRTWLVDHDRPGISVHFMGVRMLIVEKFL
jgi:hypothetical protein